MKSAIPDVANHEIPSHAKRLDRVGMSDIEVPIKLICDGESVLTHGEADAFVSLDDLDSKGIHMSRLYLATQLRFQDNMLSPQLIESTLDDFLESHRELSEDSHLSVSFKLPTKRKALLSDNQGWRTYPFQLTGTKKRGGKLDLKINFTVAYSSTCPCSAALARQLIQEKFADDFKDEKMLSKEDVKSWLGKDTSIMATPHGQRSHANISITPTHHDRDFDFINLIDLAENALKTPVQTAVKRIDEQEFARRNGENLMFAEDAARSLAKTFDNESSVRDFNLEVIHYESLHNHNAYASASKEL